MVKIYNAQMADEILVLDIKIKKKPNFELLKKLSKDCFVPLCYGGGLEKVDDVFKVLKVDVKRSLSIRLHIIILHLSKLLLVFLEDKQLLLELTTVM